MTNNISLGGKIELTIINQKEGVSDIKILGGEIFRIEENQEMVSVVNSEDETIKIMKRISGLSGKP